MVTQAHRFLYRQDPHSPALPRHCVLQGFGVSDTVYHDMYYGCVSVGRSLELWALQEWSDDSEVPIVVVRLTMAGELDFSGNADPAAAESIFEAVRGRRPPRYGQRRTSNRNTPTGEQGTASPSEEERAESSEARAASERAASTVSDSVGSGQGLVNRMNQIAAALEARQDARFLIVVDDLGSQFEDLLATGQTAIHAQAQQVLRRRWLAVSNPTGALIMYLDRDRKLSRVIDADTPGVAWWHIDGPSNQEIGEALRRIDARVPLGLNLDGGPFEGVVRALERYGDLRSALGNVARAHQQDGQVTLNGVLDLPEVDLAAADRVLAELDELVGLDDLKAGLRGMVKGALERRRRLESDGVAPEETLHLVFLGNPGTGKTTVARIVARLFHALGALPSDSFREASAKDIKSEYDGETRTNMQRLLKSALGGVLFLDEAQQFSNPEDRKSAEAIEALVPMAWNHRHELIIILAGYSAGMLDLMDMDPGLPRRFPRNRWFEFHDYTAEQLWTVLRRNLSKRGLRLDPPAELPLRRLLANRALKGGFGNAGGVENLVSEVQGLHDVRVGAGDQLLTIDDLPAQVIQRPEELAEALNRLNAMTGLDAVKTKIEAIRAELAYAELEGDDVPEAPRFRFVGPPGTGKTTVARLIGQLLYGTGLLSRKTVVEMTGASLKADYVGQTTTLVKRKFDEARGGVLFIDEAHGMVSNDSFAEDALRTLVSELTNPANRDTVVIIAGYKPEVDQLLERDPGLTRRFPNELVFAHFSPDECIAVARELLARGPRPFTADDEFFASLAELARVAAQSPTFGNAGWVNNRIEAAKSAMKVRVVTARDTYDEVGRRHLVAADLGVSSSNELAESSFAAPLPSLHEFIPAHADLPVRLADGDGPAATDVRQLIDSVVHLLITTPAGQATGTAFVVSGDHVFVTNYHVVEGATAIEVLLGPSRGSATGTVIALDQDNDLALVAVFLADDIAPIAPLPLALSRTLAPLAELIVIGNGQVRLGEEPRVVSARVGRNQELDTRSFETDGAIEEGFSGGPLWDAQQGGVVGVVVGGRGRGVKVAIRAENVAALLETIGYRTEQARDGARRN